MVRSDLKISLSLTLRGSPRKPPARLGLFIASPSPTPRRAPPCRFRALFRYPPPDRCDFWQQGTGHGTATGNRPGNSSNRAARGDRPRFWLSKQIVSLLNTTNRKTVVCPLFRLFRCGTAPWHQPASLELPAASNIRCHQAQGKSIVP